MNGQQYEIVGIGKMRGFGPTATPSPISMPARCASEASSATSSNYIAVQTTAPGTVRNFVGDIASLRAIGPAT